MFIFNRLSALRPISLSIVIALLLVFSFGAYAFATGNVITACAKRDGDVYLIGAGFQRTACAHGDQALTWNVHTTSKSIAHTAMMALIMDPRIKSFSTTFLAVACGNVQFTCGFYKDRGAKTLALLDLF